MVEDTPQEVLGGQSSSQKNNGNGCVDAGSSLQL